MDKEDRCSLFRKKPGNRHKAKTTGDCGPTSRSSSTVAVNDNITTAATGNPPQNQKSTKSKITRNPFINFLREFRKKYTTLSIVQSTKEAAKVWKSMSEAEKAPYIASARMAPKQKRKSRKKNYDDDDDDDDYDSESSAQSASTYRSRSRKGRTKRHTSRRERSNHKKKRCA